MQFMHLNSSPDLFPM